jgi:hypothetical protein
VAQRDKVVHVGTHQGDEAMSGGSFSLAWRLPMVETDVEAMRCSSRCSRSSMGSRGSFGV